MVFLQPAGGEQQTMLMFTWKCIDEDCCLERTFRFELDLNGVVFETGEKVRTGEYSSCFGDMLRASDVRGLDSIPVDVIRNDIKKALLMCLPSYRRQAH